MKTNSMVLKVTNLNKQYGKGCAICNNSKDILKCNYCLHCGTVFACRDISLELYQGEILGIVGESGSGKSTLMRILFFDEEPTLGDYRIFQYEKGLINIFNENRFKQNQIKNYLLGMVYQNPMLGLHMDFTSMSNIAEKMIDAGERNVEKIVNRSLELLERVNIPRERSLEAPKNFSGGMQQRVQIAKAVSNFPPILFLDEVTTGLDLSVQAEVLELIKQIQRDLGISMIVVSHDLSVIRMLSTRTIVMYNGEIVEEGLTDQILEDPQHEYTQKLVYSII